MFERLKASALNGLPVGEPRDAEALIAWQQRHYARVRRLFAARPSGSLLEFNLVHDDPAVICDFIGVPRAFASMWEARNVNSMLTTAAVATAVSVAAAAPSHHSSGPGPAQAAPREFAATINQTGLVALGRLRPGPSSPVGAERVGAAATPQLPAAAAAGPAATVDTYHGIPKLIWMYWAQDAPFTKMEHRLCHHSWVANNPGWTVRVVHKTTLATYLDPGAVAGIAKVRSLPSQSDLVRLHLLAKHGGVYADADVFAVMPLEKWLSTAVGAGFFAFALQGRDRGLASWFLAAAPGNLLVARWSATLLEHAKQNGFRFAKYFQIHYEFDKLVALRGSGGDPAAAQIWAETPKINATISTRDQCCSPILPPERGVPRCAVRHMKHGFCTGISVECRQMFESMQLPVLKGIAKRGARYCPEGAEDVPPQYSILRYLVDNTLLGSSAP